MQRYFHVLRQVSVLKYAVIALFIIHLLPIWVQSVAFEGGDLSGRLVRGLGEFAGMRAYPVGAFGEMRFRQDELAQEEYNRSWENLNKLEQLTLLNKTPDLKELSEKAEEEDNP